MYEYKDETLLRRAAPTHTMDYSGDSHHKPDCTAHKEEMNTDYTFVGYKALTWSLSITLCS